MPDGERPVALRLEEVSAGYGANTVLHGVSFSAAAGTLTAVVGLNGAGKSTLLRTVSGLKRPTAGRVTVDGVDLHTRAGRRAEIALVLQGVVLDRQLTGRESLQFAARARGLSGRLARQTVEAVVDELALQEFVDRRGHQLSGGQARRLQLGSSLVRRPRILLLDEPTGGLDPSARRRYWPLIRAFTDRGVTVVAVTHYIDEANQADVVLVVADGRVVSSGHPEHLTSRAAVSVVRIDCDAVTTAEVVHQALLARSATRSEATVTVSTSDVSEVMDSLECLGLGDAVELHVRPATLDDLLLYLAVKEDAHGGD